MAPVKNYTAQPWGKLNDPSIAKLSAVQSFSPAKLMPWVPFSSYLSDNTERKRTHVAKNPTRDHFFGRYSLYVAP